MIGQPSTPRQPSRAPDPFRGRFLGADEETVSWRPERDQQAPRHLIGEIVDIEGRTTRYSERQGDTPVLSIRCEDSGTLYEWWATSTVARNELARHRPRVGERIGIRYLGRHGDGYHLYRVRVDRAEAADGGVDWDAVAAAGSEAPTTAEGDPPPTDPLAPDPDDDLPF